MRRLIFLISTAGKSSKQIKKETWVAYQKYLRAEEKTLQAFVKLFQSRGVPEKAKELQDELDKLKQQYQLIEPNSSVTPATTPPVNAPKLSTDYPHSRKSQKPLSNQELVQQANQELQTAGLVLDPSLKSPPGTMLVHFFRKNPKYPKK